MRHSHRPIRSPVPPARALALVLALASAWLGSAPRARADGCEGCPGPSIMDLRRHPDFLLEDRERDGEIYPDYFELDAGGCAATLDGQPEVTIEDAWLVLRGQGEVWNCPHSKSVDQITITTSSTDSSTWSFTTTLGAGLKALGASFQSQVQEGRTTGASVTEVTSVSKTITPAACHRIQWKGLFEVVQLKAVGTYSFTRRWAWWTKNVVTEEKVLRKGDVFIACGSGTLEMTRQAPIAGHFELAQRACSDPGCAYVVTKHLGMFPPWTDPDGPLEDGPLEDGPLEDGPPEEDASGDEGGDGDPVIAGGEEPTSEPTGSEDLPPPPAGAGDDPLREAP